MTPAKSDFRKYMDQTGSLPPDAILGWIVIFQVREAAYDRSVMEAAFDEFGLDPSKLPAHNNPLHAFQKATMSVDDATYELPNGRVAHILVREAREDKNMVVRQLTREIRDPKRGALGYSKIGQCVFYRPASKGGKMNYGTERIRLTIDHNELTVDERPALQNVVDKIASEYDRHRDFMDNMKYRAVIRGYLEFLNGLKLKDSFYFVHSNRRDELDKLRGLVERMGGGTSLFTMPLVDLGAQRQMVIDAYQAEAEEALNDVVKKIAVVRSTREKITPAAYAQLKKQYETAVRRSKEYSRTLKIRQTTTTGAEELALTALTQLQEDLLAAAS